MSNTSPVIGNKDCQKCKGSGWYTVSIDRVSTHEKPCEDCCTHGGGYVAFENILYDTTGELYEVCAWGCGKMQKK